MPYLFRDENRIISGGRPYGIAFAEALISRGLLPEDKPTFCLAGDGGGDNGVRMLEVFPHHCKDLHLVNLDISPGMLKAQEERYGDLLQNVSSARFVQGNAEKIHAHVPEADLVVLNEVVADFRVIKNVPLTEGGEPSGIFPWSITAENRQAWGIAWGNIKKYGIPVPPLLPRKQTEDEGFVLQHGVIKCIESLVQMLPCGAHAVITEYVGDPPEKLSLVEHDEYSLAPSQLKSAATAKENKLELVESGTIPNLLDFDPDLRIIDPALSYKFLRQREDPEITNEQIRREITEGSSHGNRIVCLDEEPKAMKAYNLLRGSSTLDEFFPKAYDYYKQFEYYILRKKE